MEWDWRQPVRLQLRRMAPVAALLLVLLALRWALDAPESESPGLALAILMALPWSLVLTLFDFTDGYADRAAWIVTAGLGLNLWFLFNIVGWLWEAHAHRRADRP